ncbi:MAG: hypothetical protein MZV63_68825 [Marinilabiliales bacterium]|nr:hypothetical protein [Marinilabiliales bacterium]
MGVKRLGQRRIWLYDTSTGKTKKIFTVEPKFEQTVDYTYPVLTWHPGRADTDIHR